MYLRCPWRRLLSLSTSAQAHPELKSKVLNPAPSFLGFVAASVGCLDKMIEAAHKKRESQANGAGEAHDF